jgi:hypothetical protein
LKLWNIDWKNAGSLTMFRRKGVKWAVSEKFPTAKAQAAVVGFGPLRRFVAMQQDVGWEGKPDGRRTGSAPPDRSLPEDLPERLQCFVLAAGMSMKRREFIEIKLARGDRYWRSSS